MEEQKEILEKFKATWPHLTLLEMAAILGMNRTRFYRIVNGYEMKLSEYLAVKKGHPFRFSLGEQARQSLQY